MGTLAGAMPEALPGPATPPLVVVAVAHGLRLAFDPPVGVLLDLDGGPARHAAEDGRQGTVAVQVLRVALVDGVLAGVAPVALLDADAAEDDRAGMPHLGGGGGGGGRGAGRPPCGS